MRSGVGDAPSLEASGRLTAGRSPAAPILARLRSPRVVYPLITLIVIASVWEVGATLANSLLIPTFTETFASLGALFVDEQFWTAMTISNQALAVGFAAALVVGVPFGLALGRYRSLSAMADPYLTILLTIPVAGLIPLLVMSVGIGFGARVVVVFLFAVVVLAVNARAGVREVDPTLLEMARSFGCKELDIWRRVVLPSSVPALLAGIRLGLSHAVTGMVIVELLLVAAGIGYLILKFQAFLQPGALYATVVAVLIEAHILITVADRIARFATPWIAVEK
jgi:ABC-type nitrate/sulfonate/bicarbonate transport system permease component